MSAPTLGQRFRNARKREGLTQEALGLKISVTQATIANYEAESSFNPATRQKLEEILGPLTLKKSLLMLIVSRVNLRLLAFGYAKTEPRKAYPFRSLPRRLISQLPRFTTLKNGRIKNPQSATKSSLAAVFNEKIPEEIEKEIDEEQRIEGLGSLIDFDPLDKAKWPPCSGVYVLYDVSQRPIYVGKAKKIAGRLGSHEQKFWFKYPIVAYGSFIEVMDKNTRHQLEQVLIKFLKTNAVLNKQSVESFEEEE
jgi:transcriptional regulator with XRE-family HTH domain